MATPQRLTQPAGPARATRPGWRDLPLELGLVAVAVVVNLWVRAYTLDDHDEAVANAADVLALEQALGLDWEHAVQELTLAVPGLVTLASWYYVAGYFPVIGSVLVWLFVRHRATYRRLRTALLASGAVGMLGYAFYPTAPPRLTTFGFADPVAAGELGDAARPEGLANELAAIPSFHVGWLLLAVVAAASVVRSRWLRVVLLLQPVVMSVVIVATANHWVLDVPPGLAVAAVGAVVAWKVHGPVTVSGPGTAAAASP